MTLLSMNEVTTFRWSFEEDVENYQLAGYRSIGVWRQKVTDGGEDEAIDLISSCDLSVSHLSWAGGFTGSDGRSLSESVDDVVDALHLAARMRAGCLVIYPGGRNNHTFRHAGRLLRTALNEILPFAEDLEIPLALEPMHAACATDWTFLTDIDSVLDILEEFDSPLLKLAYDTYHFPCTRGQLPALADLAPHLALVHLGDRRLPPNLDQERCPLGSGRVPLLGIVTTLQDAGYSGAFDVKLMGQEIEGTDYWQLLEHSQTAFFELTGVAAPGSFA